MNEMDRIALRLDEVCPWSETSKVLNHSSWIDVLTCIKAISETAYQELVKWIEQGGVDAKL